MAENESKPPLHEKFRLKTDDADDEKGGPARKGRLYSSQHGAQPGGIKVRVRNGIKRLHLYIVVV